MTDQATLAVDDPVLFEFAAAVGPTGPVAVVGGRTRWEVGGDPVGDPRLVEAPVGIVAYHPEEMTVQVRAGTSVADLDRRLAEHGQRCGLPDRGGTVGGAVMVGENHLDRLGRGSVRDAVLQVRYVSAEGTLVTGGGPVVKNVTGFNLPKLLPGSLGTLGCLAEVILRTNPTPSTDCWVTVDGVDPLAVRDAVLRPAAVMWDGEVTHVHLEGHEVDVDAGRDALEALGRVEDASGPPPLPPHRWSMSTRAMIERPPAGRFVASLGAGVVWSDLDAPPAAPSSPAVAELAARTKQTFDPTGRLNPGRVA